MLEKILLSLGLNQDEIAVYRQLVNGGTATAGAIAQKTGLVRPTVYNHLRKMRDLGIVLQGMKSGVRNFVAAPPEKIDQLFEARAKELRQQQARFKAIMPELHKRLRRGVVQPKIRIFDGVEGVRNILMDILLYREVKTYTFWSIKASLDLLTPDFFRFHNAERIRNKIHIQAIWPHNQAVSFKRYPFMGTGEGFYRDLRLAPPDVDSDMGYWIYGNKVAFLSSARECFGFCVESLEFTEMMVRHHRMIWNLSKPVATNLEDTRVFLASL